MDALVVLLAMVTVLVLFDVAALRWGADSRDRITSTWLHREHMGRGV